MHRHAQTHTHTHIHAHIFPRLLKACSREFKSIGVGDREIMSLQLRFEGRQSLTLSMSHREKKIVPDWKDGVQAVLVKLLKKPRLLLVERAKVSAPYMRTGMTTVLYTWIFMDRWSKWQPCSVWQFLFNFIQTQFCNTTFQKLSTGMHLFNHHKGLYASLLVISWQQGKYTLTQMHYIAWTCA